MKPENFTANSEEKVWWKCDKGHEWKASIGHRNKGRGCPYCANKKALMGYNDLQTLNPKLASEWNYKKNKMLAPTSVLPNSNKIVWWKCKKGHEWQATIANRNDSKGCPICNSERHTSYLEFIFVFYLKKYKVQAIHSYKEKGYELDIYIPSKKIAIECDGHFWHKNKIKKDLEKNLKCKRDGIKLYRLREGLSSLNDYSIDYIVQEKQKNLVEVVQKVLTEIIGIKADIDLKRDSIAIENLRDYTEKINSLLFVNPELAKEWNYEKNGELKPENFLVNSAKKVWWKCKKGHEWQATIASRGSGRGCPYCANKKVVVGYNDLATLNPKLASEWNFEKNNGLTPTEVVANSHIKVWWKCEKGHEWQATISNRNSGRGCPICANKKVLKGYNDLLTINPKIASEWNYEKNGDLKPDEIVFGSHKTVWWKCDYGHEWQASIDKRDRGTNCPYCSGRKKPF